MQIRDECTQDLAAVRQLLTEAFGGSAEAKLVEALRVDGDLAVALVAEDVDNVVGYVALSPLKSPRVHSPLRPLPSPRAASAKASDRR